MIKAVLDTNILVSGLISPRGSPAKIIDLWQEGNYILVTSKAILNEVRRVLNCPKIFHNYHLSRKRIKEYLEGLSIFAEAVRPRKRVLVIKQDPQDNKFIEAALAGRADFLVSGDKHLLKLKEYQGMRIVTANTFLTSTNFD